MSGSASALTDLAPVPGATPVLVASLLETGTAVALVMAAHHTGPLEGRVARDEVDHLLDWLHEIAPIAEKVSDGWVSMAQGTKRARISRAELPALMFGGKIKGIARNPGESGLGAIRLDPDKVKSLAA